MSLHAQHAAVLRDKHQSQLILVSAPHFIHPTRPSATGFSPHVTLQAAGAQALNQTELAAIEGVTVSAFTPSTLQFSWVGVNSTPGAFPDQASAADAFHSMLAQVKLWQLCAVYCRRTIWPHADSKPCV